MTKKQILSLVLLLPLLSACLERNFAESEALVEVDVEQVTVPSDLEDLSEQVADTIFVATNRNWSASFTTNVDWATLSTDGGMNLARMSTVYPVILRFKNNETESDRMVDLHIGTADGYKIVHIKQSAIKYRLKVTSDQALFKDVKYETDTVALSFTTNTDWNIALKPDSEISLGFSETSGKGSSSVDVYFPENTELSTKTATILLSAKGCTTQEIAVSQVKGEPYFKVIKTLDEQRLGYKVEAGRYGRKVEFKTNSNWTVSLGNAVGIDPSTVKFSKSGGNMNDSFIEVGFDYCTPAAGLSMGLVSLNFEVEGLSSPVSLDIEQDPCIRTLYFDPLTGALNTSHWPISSPTYSQIVSDDTKAIHQNETFDIVLTNGFVMETKSKCGIVKYSSAGLILGKAVGDYIEFPAIEGMKLVKVVYVYGYTVSLTGNIKTADGTTISGGKFTVSKKGDTVTLNLSGTETGKAYRLVSASAVRIAIRDLVLYYE